jgi:hypothetical protein
MSPVLRPLLVKCPSLIVCLRLLLRLEAAVLILVARGELRRRRRWWWGRVASVPRCVWVPKRRHRRRELFVATAVPEARIVTSAARPERHRLGVQVFVHIGGGVKAEDFLGRGAVSTTERGLVQVSVRIYDWGVVGYVPG